MKPQICNIIVVITGILTFQFAAKAQTNTFPAGTNVEFRLGGNSSLYYPIYFEDGEWDKGMFVLNIQRANIHTDQGWYGSLLVQIRSHATTWGHGSNFLDYDIYMHDPYNNGPMIAAISETESREGVVIWLRGGFTYFFNSNHKIANRYDNIAGGGRLVLTVFNNEEYDIFTPRSDVDPQLEKAGHSIGQNLRVKGNVGIGTMRPTGQLTVAGHDGDTRSVTIDSGEIKFRGDAVAHMSIYGPRMGKPYLSIGDTSDYKGTGIPSKESLVINSDGKVGIGTISPTHPLTVNGAIKASSIFVETGNVSIGTSNATHKLTVSGPIKSNGLLIENGNVGINTTQATHPLTVNGTIRAKEIIVEAGWADDVFTPNYHLLSPSETKQHISQHGHLPGVPSEKQVKIEGVNLGKMQSILLRKIEELTLQMIKQDEEITSLKNENRKVHEQMQSLHNNLQSRQIGH